MLSEALAALAAAGGTSVVQSAGSDAWDGLRGRLASWFARGDGERERGELERLDRSAAALSATDDGRAEQVRAEHRVLWQTRIATLLEGLESEGRTQAAIELQQLLRQAACEVPGETALVLGNTFFGDTAVQAGSLNRQNNNFRLRP
ncbi:hypothetical protein [Streptomyces sp. NPDC002156]